MGGEHPVHTGTHPVHTHAPIHTHTHEHTHTQQRAETGEGAAAVPITVRQLEALVRLSESLAKLELCASVQVGASVRLYL